MIYLSGIILAFFLAFVLITKRGKTRADRILTVWLCFIGFHLFTFYIFFTGQYHHIPSLMVIGFSMPLVHGPFLYLYTRHQTSALPLNAKQLLHFLPALISCLLFTGFHLLPLHEKLAVIQNKGQDFGLQLMVNKYATYVSGVVYVALALSALLKYRKNLVNQFSNTEKINFNWLLYLIIWMMIIWIVILITRNSGFIFASVSFFVIWIGYFSIRQIQVFSTSDAAPVSPAGEAESKSSYPVESLIEETGDHEEVIKYQRSSLNENDVTMIYEKLKLLMYEKKPFTNPDLTLNELARMMEVHPNHLSQVINSREHKNFYDLVNERRIEEFKKLVIQSGNRQFTLLALAFDCGFNSKASFNRNFKKYTGLTPTDYLKNLSDN